MINRERIKKPPQFITKKLTTEEGRAVDVFIAKAKILIENNRQWSPPQTLEFVQGELLEAFSQLPKDIQNLHNELTWLQHPENTSPGCVNIFYWLPAPNYRPESQYPHLKGNENFMLRMFSARQRERDTWKLIEKIHVYSIRLMASLNALEKKLRVVEIIPSLQELCMFTVKSSGESYDKLPDELRAKISVTRCKPIERFKNPQLSQSQNEKMHSYYSDYDYAKNEFMLKII